MNHTGEEHKNKFLSPKAFHPCSIVDTSFSSTDGDASLHDETDIDSISIVNKYVAGEYRGDKILTYNTTKPGKIKRFASEHG